MSTLVLNNRRVRFRRPSAPARRLFGSCLIVLGLLLSQGAGAQEKSFLWKVRAEKGSLYILGSIHFLKKENYPLKKTIEEAFGAAQKLVLEIDLRSADPATVQRLTLEKGLNRDGTTLQQKISPETYSLAEQHAKELGIDIRALSPFKPWLVALTMTALQLQKLGFDAGFGVDRYLAERGAKVGKAMSGLETVGFQIGLVDQLSPQDQESMLRQSLKEMDLVDRSLDRIVRSWSTGDVHSLEELLLSAMRDYPEVHQKIIVDRNRRWLPQIEKALKQGESTLVVVGAAHLVGKDGILELLKARGYTLEQL
jgi:uncharacterized protein YbaP (TraB family)